MSMTIAADNMLATGGAAPDVAHVAPSDVLTPADRYQELFVAVQMGRVFDDSKSFPDCVPCVDPVEIMRRYRADHRLPGFDLKNFVTRHFARESVPAEHYVADTQQSLAAHIDSLWPVLRREPRHHPANSSLLPLPYDYVVPGGRFSEMYYWDSYFTMLGLAESGRRHLLTSMADNFAFLVDHYGHIPNGNRTYYLSRSQPPVFAMMVDLFETHGVQPAIRYLPQLKREYAYWMECAEDLAPGEAARHVVRLPDGALLNRYWDERDTPRDEGYLEDVDTAARSARERGEVYRDLRAGAESGWDFSSRWLADPSDLSTIRTTSILPIDLNSFLYKLETQIEKLARAHGDAATADAFASRAASRRRAIDRYLWSEKDGAFVDYDWRLGVQREGLSAALAVPLYVGLASHEQAHRAARALESRLLAAGGVRTTEQASRQQWDQPNGWAPLQWMATRGLIRYGEQALGREIAHRWLATVAAVYEREFKLVEKYSLHRDIDAASGGGGGEYPLQDGFGWTNGVVRKLLDEHPEHEANSSRAGS
ncbi:alpha,alpha-trehalase [Trinickia dabaoshanensis]|uniref:Putative periplasmic trehalase n=2 Tax=Trinickia dabaoshanensis TaxID=564714 RepID=A0A2N7VF00_9BURK|nr:alpha,alpha-trehalase [Trinickia dabaoshanensis]